MPVRPSVAVRRARRLPATTVVLLIALVAAACDTTASAGTTARPESPTATVLPRTPRSAPTARGAAPPPPTTSTSTTTIPRPDGDDPTTSITTPASGTTVVPPITVTGTATGVDRVSRLTLTIKDTGTGLYWNPTTGDWQAAWLWYDADIASTGSPSSAWSFAFDPRGTSPSGLYQATAFAWDGRGHKDPTGSRIRFSGTEQADGDDWQLLWSDEFDGASLDPHRWKAVTGAYGAPSRDQHYTTRSENVRVENGHLVLEAHDEPYGDQGHTSGMVVSNDTDEPSAGHTRGNVSWTYGRFEVRARVPDVSGMWPAFWMRPATTTYGTWPRSGEIDVLEYAGPTPRGEVNPRGRFFTSGLHTWDPSGQAPSHKHEGPVWVDEELDADFFDDFHTWAVEWEADRFRWYVDDHLFDVATRDWQAPDAPFPAPFDQPFFLTLNLQVGGWAGPVDTGALPARFEIDHVRVYG